MADNLKPCPWCGHTPEVHELGLSVECVHKDGTRESYDMVAAGCVNEECPVMPCSKASVSAAEAAEKWNTRTAVTDEQFAMAVHDGRAWQLVSECVWEVGRRKGDDGTQYFTECGAVYILEDVYPYCPNCGGRVVTTCRMVPVSLYDEEGIDGIECDECGWSDMHDWDDPMPERCPGCKRKVVAE